MSVSGGAWPQPGAMYVVLRVLALLLCLCGTTTAWAHASLLGSIPSMGSVLQTPPAEAVLQFNEAVKPLVVNLASPDGQVQRIGQVAVVGHDLHVTLPPLSMRGTYGISWRVVSADGHPLGGTLVFSVGAPGGTAAALPQADAPSLRAVLIWLTRVITYLSLFAAAAAVYAGHRERQVAIAGPRLVDIGILALALGIGLLGVDALDLPLSGLASAEAWRTAMSTSYGLAGSFFVAALVLGHAAWHRNVDVQMTAAGVVTVVLLATGFAASGHASAAPPAWLARPMVFLHAAGVALWLGVFYPLLLGLRNTREVPMALSRFARIAPAVVGAIVVSGTVLAILQLGDPAALVTTDYGRILAAKLVLVSALLGLGAWNRYHLTEPVLLGQRNARQRLQRAVAMELILAVVVLALVALWRFTPPPRATETSQTGAPVTQTSVAISVVPAMTATLRWTSSGADDSLTITLTGRDRGPLRPQLVRVLFSRPDAGVEPIAFDATPDADATTWQVPSLELPLMPSWDVRLEVLVSDFERQVLTTRMARP
jgi:copper transport protein